MRNVYLLLSFQEVDVHESCCAQIGDLNLRELLPVVSGTLQIEHPFEIQSITCRKVFLQNHVTLLPVEIASPKPVQPEHPNNKTFFVLAIMLVKAAQLLQIALTLLLGDGLEENDLVMGEEEKLSALPTGDLGDVLDYLIVALDVQAMLELDARLILLQPEREYSWAVACYFIVQRLQTAELAVHAIRLAFASPFLEVVVGCLLIDAECVVAVEIYSL
jgi:hypothetical protein